ncbi:interleukin-4 receptor subunit alpha [Menidia menidia]
MRKTRDLPGSLLLWTPLLLLLIPAPSAPDSSRGSGTRLDCSTGCESMSCRFQPQELDCSGYNLTVTDHQAQHEDKLLDCPFVSPCESGWCCCSVPIQFVMEETYSATVWKQDQPVESREISSSSSLKPQTPTDLSVRESNGNVEVQWSQEESCHSAGLKAEVAYRKKGGGQGPTVQRVRPAEAGGRFVYEISGQDLEAGATYAVSVRSGSELSERLSDSSPELEFTAPQGWFLGFCHPSIRYRYRLFPNGVAGMKPNYFYPPTGAGGHSAPVATAVSFSLAVVLLPAAAFFCYKKLKSGWCDRLAKCPVPELLDWGPVGQELLPPSEAAVWPVTVVPAVPGHPDYHPPGSEPPPATDEIQATPEWLRFENMTYCAPLLPGEMFSSWAGGAEGDQQVPAGLV